MPGATTPSNDFLFGPPYLGYIEEVTETSDSLFCLSQPVLCLDFCSALAQHIAVIRSILS